ncbi:MAG: hypothetical protein HGB30_09660 [Holophagaceae bacterium]|nr:hypothetical protein [Holophagaceae bacterium]
MLHVKRIRDLDELRRQTFQAPIALVEHLEEAEARGEPWWVLQAFGGGPSDARWVAVLQGEGESLFFSDGEHHRGRWDDEHALFIPDEGKPMDLNGRTTTLSALEDEAVELESAEAARKQQGSSRRI